MLDILDRKQPTVTSFDEDKYRGVRLVDLQENTTPKSVDLILQLGLFEQE